MATRLDKIMEPILKEKCDEAYKAGYKKGFEAGGKNMSLAYENEINSLKRELGRKRFLLKDNGEIIPLDHRWIPVTERLPEVVDSYLVVVKYKYDYEKEYSYDTDVATYNPYEPAYIDDCWNTYNDWDEGQQYIHVTHWMPLPEPPKEV